MKSMFELRKMKNYLHVFSFVIAINGACVFNWWLSGVGERAKRQSTNEIDCWMVRGRGEKKRVTGYWQLEL